MLSEFPEHADVSGARCQSLSACLLPGLHAERVARIQRRVEDVRRVCALADAELDGVLLVGTAASAVALVQFEGDV
jgi:hypothetical protein